MNNGSEMIKVYVYLLKVHKNGKKILTEQFKKKKAEKRRDAYGRFI